MKNLRLKRKITPFNCGKSNDLQEYKYLSLIKEHHL